MAADAFGAPADRRIDMDGSLVQLARDAVAGDRDGDWSCHVDELWCMLRPDGRRLRDQGWKLHLSATPVSAAELLRRALPVLVAERVAAKFAADLDGVRWLNSRGCPRGAAGKFMTVYPDDDDQFRRLAAALDRACAGLPGPEILSDRRYRPRSPVYYRFGAFAHSFVLDDDGLYRPVIRDPDGRLVEDRRDAWFHPPVWVAPVLPDQPLTPPATARSVLIGDRFVVYEAIRHSSRGGVFRARDRQTGAAVVIKQARAHIEVDGSGRDCRDRLRDEAELLRQIGPLGIAPRVVALVEEPGHLFLIEESIEGSTLRQWCASEWRDGGGVPPEAGLAVAGALIRLIDTAHRAGLVIVDVSPNNVMVEPPGTLRLIDLEHTTRAGQVVYPAGTPGYAPPEHAAGYRVPVLARPEADLFGLGGLLFLIAMGTDPALPEDGAPARPIQRRIRAWLDLAGPDLPLANMWADAITGMLAERPEARWRASRVQRYLARRHLFAARPLRRAGRRGEVDRLIEDGLSYLLAQADTGGDRLWPSNRFGARTDPCAVQHGAAGVLAALVQAAPVLPAGRLGTRVRAGVRTAAYWLAERLPEEPRLLPGLYFGRSGTAWALHDAAVLLGDEWLAGRARELAARLPVHRESPVDGASPDVAHGQAGAGTAQLHLWRATGDERFARRARACADLLVRAAQRQGAAIGWQIPAGLRSSLAGRTFHGYAHGTAGIGAFLLSAGVAFGSETYTGLALAAADTLAAAALRPDGAAFWPVEPAYGSLADAGWCQGSSGIGTFLLHAFQVTGEQSYLDLARAAAAAVHQTRLRSNPAACHGLAGGGQFLLDLADVLDDQVFRGWAESMAQALAVKAARRGGRMLVPDESGLEVTADYGVGLAGTLAFLIRLRHGGPRPWTVEQHHPRPGGAAVDDGHHA